MLHVLSNKLSFPVDLMHLLLLKVDLLFKFSEVFGGDLKRDLNEAAIGELLTVHKEPDPVVLALLVKHLGNPGEFKSDFELVTQVNPNFKDKTLWELPKERNLLNTLFLLLFETGHHLEGLLLCSSFGTRRDIAWGSLHLN
jgi:hypothetical protein